MTIEKRVRFWRNFIFLSIIHENYQIQSVYSHTRKGMYLYAHLDIYEFCLITSLLMSVFLFVFFSFFMKIVDHNGQLSKSSPDSGYPGENGDLSNGFYENLPFHGMKQQPLQPHKQVRITHRKKLSNTKMIFIGF